MRNCTESQAAHGAGLDSRLPGLGPSVLHVDIHLTGESQLAQQEVNLTHCGAIASHDRSF